MYQSCMQPRNVAGPPAFYFSFFCENCWTSRNVSKVFIRLGSPHPGFMPHQHLIRAGSLNQPLLPNLLEAEGRTIGGRKKEREMERRGKSKGKKVGEKPTSSMNEILKHGVLSLSLSPSQWFLGKPAEARRRIKQESRQPPSCPQAGKTRQPTTISSSCIPRPTAA